jgi:Domain of unknown function (DUF1707)
MAEPGDEMAAGPGGRGHLRATRAEREQVIGKLKAAFVQGMLSKDEFDLRVGQACAPRTYAELAALTADLPPGLAPVQPLTPARTGDGQPVVRPGRVLAVATVLYAGVWGYAGLSPIVGDNALAGALIYLGALAYLGFVLVCLGAIHINRQEKHSGGQPPGRPGSGGRGSGDVPPAGPGRRLPPAGPGHESAAGAVRTRRSRPGLATASG